MSNNMQSRSRRFQWSVASFGLLAVAAVIAGTIELDWYTIDSGGGTVMTGGDIEIVGVIGQPDAGVMTGGDIEIAGGFSAAFAGFADCNNNGVDDELEIEGSILRIDDDASGANTGSNWNDALTDLQFALCMAQNNPGQITEIWVAAGTYAPSELTDPKVPRSATFQLQNGVALYGGFAGFETSLEERVGLFGQTILTGDLDGDDVPVACGQDSPDCDPFGGRCIDGACIISDNNSENTYHVVTGSGTDDTAILDGLTITGGNANESFPGNQGGGMWNVTSSSATVTNCTFRGNTASEGGGMYNFDSSPTLTNCAFIGNSANFGGGMRNTTSSSPAITDCRFITNRALVLGGGIYNIGSCSPAVTNCAFIGNSALGGGGIRNSTNSSPTITNSTFTGNVASTISGGGMWNLNLCNPTITNCTFSGNSAASRGGGMFNESFSDPAVSNCIFWQNSDAGGMDESAQVHDVGDSASIVNYSNVQGGWTGAGGIGNIDADPLLLDPDGDDDIPGTEDDNLRLLAGSPAIDSGNNAAVPQNVTTDLDGESRFIDDANTPDCPQKGADCGTPPIVDMGAYEFGSDCNGNGLPDVCDLDCGAKGGACNLPGCGLSTDCNGNSLPDECEVPPIGPAGNDCDGNGEPDVCQLDGNDCDGNGVPDNCDPDCDGDGVPDACEIADCVGEPACADCNANGVPDGCEVPPIGPAENDCNDNGIPDQCDIESGFSIDCNVNGVPDDCDIASGFSQDLLPPIGVPDECIAWDAQGADNFWNTPENWEDNNNDNVENDVPGDEDAAQTENVVISGDTTDVVLNINVSIDSLLLDGGATLHLDDLGDMIVEPGGAILNRGNLLAGNDRQIDASGSAVTIGANGTYQAGDGEASATLLAGSVTLLGCPGLDEGCGGSMTLTGTMALSSSGDLALNGCKRDGKGSGTPPDFNVLGQSNVLVTGDFSICGGSTVDFSSSESMMLGGDFDNQSTEPLIFDWSAGGLTLDGVSQSIEAAGENRGPWPVGLVDNFAFGTLTLDPGVVVEVVDTFDNQQDGVVACDEALYVDLLEVDVGAVLITNGCPVYYNTLTNNGSIPGLGTDVRQIFTPGLADLDGNGEVRVPDLIILLSSWGLCPEPCTPGEPADTCAADLDGNCEVRVPDLIILLAAWG